MQHIADERVNGQVKVAAGGPVQVIAYGQSKVLG
jgi:hypothetical protein